MGYNPQGNAINTAGTRTLGVHPSLPLETKTWAVTSVGNNLYNSNAFVESNLTTQGHTSFGMSFKGIKFQKGLKIPRQITIIPKPELHPWKLTWNPKMKVLEDDVPFQTGHFQVPV